MVYEGIQICKLIGRFIIKIVQNAVVTSHLLYMVIIQRSQIASNIPFPYGIERLETFHEHVFTDNSNNFHVLKMPLNMDVSLVKHIILFL